MKQKLVQIPDSKTYIGLTSKKIKIQTAAHKTAINFKPEKKNYNQYTNSTELSKLIKN